MFSTQDRRLASVGHRGTPYWTLAKDLRRVGERAGGGSPGEWETPETGALGP